MLAGWYTTEIGRQPWLVYGVLTTAQAAGPVPAPTIALTLAIYIAMYLALVVAYVATVFRLARKVTTEEPPRSATGSLPAPGCRVGMNELETALQAPGGWLPLAILAIMGLAMLAYVILDGYDLGVGTLLGAAGERDKDTMVASIGPFWDANETWLVLGVGILLVAFPPAHGLILGALYLPVALMLVGLTLRGVAFDFRTKGGADRKALWNRAFSAGSVLASLAQGYMLGQWVTGFRGDGWATLFSALIAVCLLGTHMLLGAGWLIMKTEGALQVAAVRWARVSLGLTAVGVVAISAATPLVGASIFERWFALPDVVLLAPLPLATLLLFFIVERSLRRLPTRLEQDNAYGDGVPFAGAVGIAMLAFYGLAYSLLPWLVVDRLTVWQAASSTESLWMIFVGACVVLPVIVGYTVFSHPVFAGKATALQY